MPKGKGREPDRLVTSIDITQGMLTKLKAGFTDEPLEDLEKLAREICIATLAIETVVTARYNQGRHKLA